jgi:GNAT superfamily N-acetyltransferase
MQYEEPEICGNNKGMPWTYSGTNYMEIYAGFLETNHKRIGNLELRLIGNDSPDNLDSYYIWYSLSDFFIDPNFRKKGFGKIMLERATNFAREKEIAIVKRIKASPEALHVLEDFAHFLESNGFQRFDDKTFYYTYDGEKVENPGEKS